MLQAKVGLVDLQGTSDERLGLRQPARDLKQRCEVVKLNGNMLVKWTFAAFFNY